MPRMIHFDVSADDPERAIRFYEDVFGWKIERWEGPLEYWQITTGSPDEPGIDGGLARRDAPWQTITPIFGVSSADEFAEKIEAAGGTIVQPKTAITGIGHLVSFKDTEGNVMAVLEADESVA